MALSGKYEYVSHKNYDGYMKATGATAAEIGNVLNLVVLMKLPKRKRIIYKNLKFTTV